MTTSSFSRRTVLAGAAALTSLAATRPGFAADKKIVVGTWGGDYSKLITKNIDNPILVPAGWEVIHDEASDAPRRAKMVAEKRLPRGTSDVQALSSLNVAEMVAAETLEKLDLSKIPNAQYLLPALKPDAVYSMPHIYSGLVLLYNPKLIDPAPTSVADLWNPKYAGKVGVIDIQYQWTMMAAGMAAGGKMQDLAAAQKALLEAKNQGAKIYPTNEALAQALKTEEIGLCVMWKARAVQWQNAGIPIQAVAPKEGILLYVSEFAIPKNAQDKAGAYAFLNAMLMPSAQEAFAVDMGYNPTVTNAKVPPELQAKIGFTADEQKRLVNTDAAFIVANDAAMKEWWDKSFKG